MLAKRNENYLPSFFDRFLNNELMDWGHSNFSSTNTSLPAVNVKETADDFVIELAAPGMEKKDFKIKFKNNVINYFLLSLFLNRTNTVCLDINLVGQ